MSPICVINLLFFAMFACGVHLPSEICKVYTARGEVNIGGIFSLHKDGGPEEKKCGARLPVSALQLTEAMAFAVNAINQNDTVLPNIKLGFRIYDDCSEMNYALWESMALVIGAQPDLQYRKSKTTCKVPGNHTGTAKRVIAMGFVGPGTHSSTELVLSTATLFKRPVISYGATSYELFRDNEDGYFFSTIPSDRHKAQAIVDLLVYFQWNHSSLVLAGNDEAEDFGKEVINLASDARLCIRKLGNVEHDDNVERQLQHVVDELRENHVNVTVLVSSSPSAANAVLSAASTAMPPLANVTWIVSYLLEEDFIVENETAPGGLFIHYHNSKLTEFEEHFRSLILNVDKSTSNPWLGEFCKDSDICQTSSEQGFSTRIPTLAPVIDAVFALAYALNKTIDEECEDGLPYCLMKEPKVDKKLKDNVNGVSFPGSAGPFRFKNNSVPGHFEILNKQLVNGTIEMVNIGSWRSGDTMQLDINESLIQWSGNRTEIPVSRCWKNCPPGEVVVPVGLEDLDPIECCRCERCKGEEWPINDFTCAELQKNAVSWHELPVIILVSLSSIGLLLCVLTSYGMVRYRHQALIKATSRELSAVNILGIALAFLAVFSLLCQPSLGVCGLAKTLYVLSFTVMYAPFCLKVNRIYRIFESSKKSAKPPRFTGATTQLVIVAVLVSIQLIIITISALVEVDTWISVRDLYYEMGEKEKLVKTREIFCKFDAAGMKATMCYNLLLLLASCYFAYRARNVPGNFNEARFYVISVYTNMLPIAAAPPIFLKAERAACLAISVCLMPICNGYVTLGGVYIPKLYAIIAKKTVKGDRDRALGEPSQMGTSSTHQNLRSFVLSKGGSNKVQPFGNSNADGND